MGMIYLSRQRSQWRVELGCRCLGFPRSATQKTSWQLWRGNFLQTLLKERGSRWFRHKQFFLHQWSPTTAYLEMSSSKPGWNQYYTELNNVILPYYQHQLKLMTDLCLIDKTQRHTYLLHVSIFFFKIILRLGKLMVGKYVNTKVLWLIPYFFNFCCLRLSEEAAVVWKGAQEKDFKRGKGLKGFRDWSYLDPKAVSWIGHLGYRDQSPCWWRHTF